MSDTPADSDNDVSQSDDKWKRIANSDNYYFFFKFKPSALFQKKVAFCFAEQTEKSKLLKNCFFGEEIAKLQV